MRRPSLLLPLCSLAVIALALLAAPVRAEEKKMVENPAYKEWAKHKVGALARYEMVNDAMGGQKITMTQTLVELTESKAVIQTSMAMDMGGQVMQVPGQKREEPKMVAEGTLPMGMPASSEKPTITEGTASVTTPAGTFDCKWTEGKGKSGDGTYVFKVWNSDQVPGGMVMMETQSTSGGQTTKTSMKLIEMKKP